MIRIFLSRRGEILLEQAKHRLKSERGASLSMALLLMLVCVAISSIVLAAATTSAGRLAQAGEYDQRYYAVTSAARMFEKSLDGGSKYTLTQTIEGEGAATNPAVIFEPESDDIPGYDFLSNLTCFAFFGVPYDSFDPASYDPSAVCDGGWVEPFASTNWSTAALPNDNDYVTATYDVAMSDVDGTSDDPNSSVEVEARLHSDWSLELVFANKGHGTGEGSTLGDKFNVYMLLQADVENEESIYAYTEPKVRTLVTHVMWECVSLQQGRGFPSES